MELYRRLARSRSLNPLADFRREVVDRFGAPPKPAEDLPAKAEIRIIAGAWKIERVHIETGLYVVLTYLDTARIEALPAATAARSALSTPAVRTSRSATTTQARRDRRAGAQPAENGPLSAAGASRGYEAGRQGGQALQSPC